MTIDLHTSQWFNTLTPVSLSDLQGRVVVITVFQMLCPGCVAHSIPQAKALHSTFSHEDVVVLGLHSVFEHHDAMTPVALQAFLSEYRVTFPVAIDQASSTSPIPRTMQAWDLQGTPSVLVLDRQGQLQLNHFGHMDDLRLGALIGQLMAAP